MSTKWKTGAEAVKKADMELSRTDFVGRTIAFVTWTRRHNLKLSFTDGTALIIAENEGEEGGVRVEFEKYEPYL
jgi:hypothetical protein